MRWTPIRGPGGQKQRLALATALLALNAPAGAVSCRMLASATPLPAPVSTRMEGRWAFVPTMARVGPCSSFHSSRVLSLPAAPRKRIPDRTVEVRCSGCKALIYKYAKVSCPLSGPHSTSSLYVLSHLTCGWVRYTTRTIPFLVDRGPWFITVLCSSKYHRVPVKMSPAG